MCRLPEVGSIELRGKCPTRRKTGTGNGLVRLPVVDLWGVGQLHCSSCTVWLLHMGAGLCASAVPANGCSFLGNFFDHVTKAMVWGTIPGPWAILGHIFGFLINLFVVDMSADKCSIVTKNKQTNKQKLAKVEFSPIRGLGPRP